MKQVEYTDKQKEIIELLKPFKELVKNNPYDLKSRIKELISKTEKKYDIKPLLLTLREYLNEKSRGAYHHFIFRINNVDINVIGVSDFSRTFNDYLLDKYYVVEDKTTNNGGDCCNYECKHYLKLEEKE